MRWQGAGMSTSVPSFEGIHNFRDYGGYQAEGGSVRRGLLYRSGQHVAASDADLREGCERLALACRALR